LAIHTLFIAERLPSDGQQLKRKLA